MDMFRARMSNYQLILEAKAARICPSLTTFKGDLWIFHKINHPAIGVPPFLESLRLVPRVHCGAGKSAPHAMRCFTWRCPSPWFLFGSK